VTTIAYKEGVIAYESRTTAGDLITSDDSEKCVIEDGKRFFICGATSDRMRLVNLYIGKSEDSGKNDCSAFVLDDGQLYLTAVDPEDGLWIQPLPLDKWHSIGSGSNFALTAMDMGADAKEAVKMAIRRDCKSGGKIRTYKLCLK
jgi:20S proteasome alpha/beta subunit